jgi:hypothetical protein
MDIQLIEDAYQSITTYSSKNGRLGLQDLIVFDLLVGMHENDMSDLEPYVVWTTTPDEIMQSIIDSNKTFTIDFGWEDLIDSLRDYMTAKGFIVDSDDLDEKEYQRLIEGRK